MTTSMHRMTCSTATSSYLILHSSQGVETWPQFVKNKDADYIWPEGEEWDDRLIFPLNFTSEEMQVNYEAVPTPWAADYPSDEFAVRWLGLLRIVKG